MRWMIRSAWLSLLLQALQPSASTALESANRSPIRTLHLSRHRPSRNANNASSPRTAKMIVDDNNPNSDILGRNPVFAMGPPVRVPEPRDKARSCKANQRNGTCTVYEDVSSQCWDKDVEESGDCLENREACCLERRQMTVDDTPCGITGVSVLDDRNTRFEASAEACWMAALVGHPASGKVFHVCDGVIVDSGHIMTSAECLMKVRDMGSLVRSLSVVVGNGKLLQRQSSLDFPSEKSCGQEYQIARYGNFTDRVLKVLALKGYVILRIRGRVLKNHCTCRICAPSAKDFAALSTTSQCAVSGFIRNEMKSLPHDIKLDLVTYPTRLITQSMCLTLLQPQNLPGNQTARINQKLMCSLSGDVRGQCDGGMGGSLTCIRGTYGLQSSTTAVVVQYSPESNTAVNRGGFRKNGLVDFGAYCTSEHPLIRPFQDSDQRHVLIGLIIQPIDCYTAPRLSRNIVGCFGKLNEISTACRQPEIRLSNTQNTCGRIKSVNNTDPFGLAFQTKSGSFLRHMSIGRRMQMQSQFPVPDWTLMERMDFQQSEISNPGLHLLRAPLICWEAAVYNPTRGHCSGVLLTDRFVLTAAHCVTEENGLQFTKDVIRTLRVFVGFDSIPRSQASPCEEISEVKSIRLHPSFVKPSGIRFYDLNDIALVELASPVDLERNPCVCTICLDSVSKPAPGELCTLSGYGCPAAILASESCPAPRPWPLTWSNVINLGDTVCGAIPDYPKSLMSCTVTDGGPSGCYGDSGGPLVCYDPQNQRHYLHAVFSFILSVNQAPQKCRTHPLNPDYYTKVSNYLPWLIENVPGLEVS